MSSSEILEYVKNLPAVREAIAKKQGEQEAGKLRTRLAILDEIDAAIAEAVRLEKLIAAQQPKLEAVRQAFQREEARMGELQFQLQDAHAREGRACTRLGEHGEAPVEGAVCQLDSGARSLAQQIAELKANPPPGDRFTVGLSPKQREHQRKINDLIDRYKRVQSALAAAMKLRGARISPRDLAAKVDALLESLKVADE